jgi:ankyrin repeat protein
MPVLVNRHWKHVQSKPPTLTYHQAKLNRKLLIAIEKKQVVRVKRLLKRGADVHYTDYRGETAIHLAAPHCSTDMIEVLLHAGAKINGEDSNGRTPIHSAALFGSNVETLIQAGADINHKANSGTTPLHVASTVDSVKTLLRAGADVHSRDRWGKTPLHMVWSAEVADALLSAGADVNSRDCENLTPLHCVHQSSKSYELAELLVNAGADLNARADREAMTPLSWIQANPPRQICSYSLFRTGPSRSREAAFSRHKAKHAKLIAFLQQCTGTG